MKCIIPGVNLKVFGRAIHSLAKIGDDLYFEPLEQGLSLRTVNSSRSAYACFLFFPTYFQHYDDGSKDPVDDDDSEAEGLRCKIMMKSVMAVFRSLSNIEKTVEKCKIMHNAKESRLVFELHCRHGIVKTHNLAYIECETLQAIYSKDMCPNKLAALSKLLCEVVVNFQTTQEEITLSVRPDRVSLRNYVEDEPDPNKVVHTELNLAPDEFSHYQVGVDTDITFCLKELRAILAFGETTGLPLSIAFERAGRPVTFCIDSDQTFEANFVLATLAEDAASQLPPSQRPAQSSSASRPKQHSSYSSKHVRGKGAPTTNYIAEKNPAKAPSLDLDRGDAADQGAEDFPVTMEAVQEQEEEEESQSPRATGHEVDSRPRGAAAHRCGNVSIDVHAQRLSQGQAGSRIATDGDERRKRGEAGREKEGRGLERKGKGLDCDWEEDCDESRCSPVIPLLSVGDVSFEQRHKSPSLQPVEAGESGDENEELDETIPGTPPAKKFRSLLFGSSQKTQTSQLCNAQVLAADTDEEDC